MAPADCEGMAVFNERSEDSAGCRSLRRPLRIAKTRRVPEKPLAGICASRDRLKMRPRSRSGLSGAVNAIFEAGQLLRAHRAPRVEFTGGYADLGAETELAAIGELG